MDEEEAQEILNALYSSIQVHKFESCASNTLKTDPITSTFVVIDTIQNLNNLDNFQFNTLSSKIYRDRQDLDSTYIPLLNEGDQLRIIKKLDSTNPTIVLIVYSDIFIINTKKKVS